MNDTIEVIKRLRFELHVTQHELAKMLGVSNRTVESWEQGERNPGEENSAKIYSLKKGIGV